MGGLLGLVILFGAGIFANVVAPYPVDQIDLTHVLEAPTLQGHHFLGTDGIGRDFLSRILFGIRTSEEVGVFVAVVSSFIGLVVGAIAGYYSAAARQHPHAPHRPDADAPAVRRARHRLGAARRRASQWRISFILALLLWTTIARVVRGVFLSLREKEYVEAAKASGAGDLRIMFRHILPNTLGPVVVAGTIAVATAILIEAALSFLGFGIKPPTPSLGVLISDGPELSAAVVADRVPGARDRR